MTDAQAEWARCRDWIISALPYNGGTHTIEDIEKEITAGTMIFVPGKHCAVVLEISTFPQGKALNVFGGGGESGAALKEYLSSMDRFICDFAKNAGCRWIMHYCRPSGEKIGKRLGYRKLWSVMLKDAPV